MLAPICALRHPLWEGRLAPISHLRTSTASARRRASHKTRL